VVCTEDEVTSPQAFRQLWCKRGAGGYDLVEYTELITVYVTFGISSWQPRIFHEFVLSTVLVLACALSSNPVRWLTVLPIPWLSQGTFPLTLGICFIEEYGVVRSIWAHGPWGTLPGLFVPNRLTHQSYTHEVYDSHSSPSCTLQV
jgi:hypothetical protein